MCLWTCEVLAASVIWAVKESAKSMNPAGWCWLCDSFVYKDVLPSHHESIRFNKVHTSEIRSKTKWVMNRFRKFTSRTEATTHVGLQYQEAIGTGMARMLPAENGRSMKVNWNTRTEFLTRGLLTIVNRCWGRSWFDWTRRLHRGNCCHNRHQRTGGYRQDLQHKLHRQKK